MDVFQAFQAELAAQPQWVQVWVNWLGLVGIASVFFVRRVEARWVLLAFLLGAATVLSLFAVQGFTRLLGLGHIVFWTPLVLYLWHRRELFRPNTVSGIYLRVAIITFGISLAFDYVDLIRYFLGHGY